MTKYINEATSYMRNLISNKRFWQIQWLSLQYFMKYVAKYKLLIMLYSLTMSYLYVELTKESFTDVQSQGIVSALVMLFIVARQLWCLLSVVKLGIPTDNKIVFATRKTTFLKQLLFTFMVTSSGYLRMGTIIKHTSIESLPTFVIVDGISAVFCLVAFQLCIRMFWKRLNQQVIIDTITSNEPLDIDVCPKVHFSTDWNEFIKGLELGVTYQYSRTENLYYDRAEMYTTESDTSREQNVFVKLRYSLATFSLKRLESKLISRKSKFKSINERRK